MKFFLMNHVYIYKKNSRYDFFDSCIVGLVFLFGGFIYRFLLMVKQREIIHTLYASSYCFPGSSGISILISARRHKREKDYDDRTW